MVYINKFQNLLVYDHHNVLYLYGLIDAYIEILENRGFMKTNEILFPVPHFHIYHEENDPIENEIITNYKWKYFQLVNGDV